MISEDNDQADCQGIRYSKEYNAFFALYYDLSILLHWYYFVAPASFNSLKISIWPSRLAYIKAVKPVLS